MSASSHAPLHIAVLHSVNVKYSSFRLGEDTNARSKNTSICYDFPYASRIYVSVCVVDCTHSLDSELVQLQVSIFVLHPLNPLCLPPHPSRNIPLSEY
jgi:hypothetical protein